MEMMAREISLQTNNSFFKKNCNWVFFGYILLIRNRLHVILTSIFLFWQIAVYIVNLSNLNLKPDLGLSKLSCIFFLNFINILSILTFLLLFIASLDRWHFERFKKGPIIEQICRKWVWKDRPTHGTLYEVKLGTLCFSFSWCIASVQFFHY